MVAFHPFDQLLSLVFFHIGGQVFVFAVVMEVVCCMHHVLPVNSTHYWLVLLISIEKGLDSFLLKLEVFFHDVVNVLSHTSVEY